MNPDDTTTDRPKSPQPKETPEPPPVMRRERSSAVVFEDIVDIDVNVNQNQKPSFDRKSSIEKISKRSESLKDKAEGKTRSPLLNKLISNSSSKVTSLAYDSSEEDKGSPRKSRRRKQEPAPAAVAVVRQRTLDPNQLSTGQTRLNAVLATLDDSA